VTLEVKRNTIQRSEVFGVSEGAGVSEEAIAVDRKSMGHTVGDRSVERSRLSVYLL
jgi:hypothetical protein